MELTGSRKGKTIGSKLTRTLVRKDTIQKDTFLGVKNNGMYPCLNYKQCKYVMKGKTFKHPVYAIVCPCGMIYVGETVQKIKSWISQHKSTIKLGNMGLPLSKHFKEKGHTAEQLRFTVLEMVPPLERGGDHELRLKQREVWWINKLNSLHPHGLNKDYNLYLFL
ncbi:hypothetical protein XELAEV_18026767mg [Xenopus laevis]|uniref:GIY-YIG domain-containing protein n=1 Tax=Xenopus laevis TaxID=8355 RepID=A0A974HJM8_XENLA|nr:hypothetical protein XELAEV_18026767mg [Xenopus laevis]